MKSLRFGIICNGSLLEHWQAACLKQLLRLSDVRLVLLIKFDGCENFQSLLSSKRESDESHAPRLLFSKIIFRSRALRKASTDSFFSNVTSIHCKTILNGELRFADEDVERIAEYDLDFILSFSFERITGAITNLPRYGIWCFHHGDVEGPFGVPACFWEIYNAKNVTASFLLKLTDTPNAFVVLRKGYFKTVDYSYSRNVDYAYLGSVHWPAQVCIDILEDHTAYFDRPPIYANANRLSLPTPLQTILFRLKMFRNMLRKLGVLFRHGEWNIGVMTGSIEAVLRAPLPAPVWLRKPRKRVLADPFPIVMNGKAYVLCECVDTYKGSIAIIDITDPSNPSPPVVVIELPTHVSYPYVVRENEHIYCIPETSEAREVYLYRAVDFPYKWTREAVLIKDFAAVDSTIFRHDGRWWLMCSATGQSHNLFAWHSNDIHGPWTPHMGNPIKTDIRSARPAGTPFIHNGELYRPAQDCSGTYGARLIINRIQRLTLSEFEEEEMNVIEPFRESPYPDGLHTVSSAGSVLLCDGNCVRSLGIWPIISVLRDQWHRRGTRPR